MKNTWISHLFDITYDSDIRRGTQYFEGGHVNQVTPIESGFSAVVSGGDDYFVYLEWNDDDETIEDMFCECPRFDEGIICKHIIAAALAYHGNGMGGDSKPGDPGYHVSLERIVVVDDETGQPITPFNLLATKPPRNVQAEIAVARPGQLLLTIEQTALSESGDLIPILAWNQRQTKNGHWMNPDPLSSDRGQSAPPVSAQAAQILAELNDRSIKSPDAPPRYSRHHWNPAYFSEDPLCIIRDNGWLLPGSVDAEFLQRLIEHGRLALRSSESALWNERTQTLRPLTWSNSRVAFTVEPTEREADCWILRGKYVPLESSYDNGEDPEPAPADSLSAGGPAKDVVRLPGARYGIVGDRLCELDESFESDWFELLSQQPAISVSPSDRTAFRHWAWQPGREEVAATLPPALVGRSETGTPTPVVDVAPDRYSARLTLRFLYGALPVELSDPAVIYDTAEDMMVERDFDAERRFADELAASAYRFPNVRFDSYENTISIPLDQVRSLLPELSGWQVTFSGKPLRYSSGFNIDVTSGIDWFEVRGGCDFDGLSITLPRLLRAVRDGETMIELTDGSRALVPDELDPKLARLLKLGQPTDEHIRFGTSQAMLLDLMLADRENVTADDSFRQVVRRLSNFRKVEPLDEPRGFQGQLRGYQKEGLGWLVFLERLGLGGCLADDMGLGKTVQVLALLQRRKLSRANKPFRPTLVVVPRSLVFNWIDEAARFTPRMKVLNYSGPDRKEHLESFDNYDLIVTTYGLLRRDVKELEAREFDYVILDESTAIKNADSQCAKASRVLHARHRLAMTGTPIENHLGELWSLFEFLNPGLLGRSTGFKTINRKTDEEYIGWLRGALAPYLLRRTKEEVLDDLPPKTEQTIICELTPKQRRQYDELKEYYRSMLDEKIREKGLAQAKIHVLEALLRLRQAACHPGLIDTKQKNSESAKLEVLMQQLKEVLAEDHKALVFSQFTSMLDIVRKKLDAKRIPYEFLDGSTRDRRARVKRFQEDPDCRLFLISIKAGGHGLNLTAADYIFILDPWWNPAVEAQAIDRAHRIGQSKRVFAYRLIAGDTVEEKVLALQQQKRELAEAIVASTGSLMRRLTKEDLALLLS